VVRLTYPEEVTFADVDKLAERLDSLLSGRGPMATVAELDGLRPTAMTPLVRKYIAEKADDLARRGAFIAEAIVVEHTVLRAIYRAYTWIRNSQPYPTQCFSTTEDATLWARAQLTKSSREKRATSSVA
jgi:hypothetical protein